MMVELKPGQLVRSLAGRDRGKHYLILGELDQKYVFLVDGQSRPVSRPKKKNKAHLQHYDRRVKLDETLDDSQVIRAIKELISDSGVTEEEV
jgi:ribosomal protein L14E/L6E/L27E